MPKVQTVKGTDPPKPVSPDSCVPRFHCLYISVFCVPRFLCPQEDWSAGLSVGQHRARSSGCPMVPADPAWSPALGSARRLPAEWAACLGWRSQYSGSRLRPSPQRLWLSPRSLGRSGQVTVPWFSAQRAPGCLSGAWPWAGRFPAHQNCCPRALGSNLPARLLSRLPPAPLQLQMA